jgi:hypothetical protein
MKKKRGEGWNDLKVEIQVTENDIKKIEGFMAPIQSYYRKKDMDREVYLSTQRDRLLKK